MWLVSSPKHQFNDKDGGGWVPYVPLSEDPDGGAADGDRSVGNLVRDATEHLSTLVRAEVELAKSEVAREAKKGLKGSIFFIIALVVALYSSFFFFFFLGELLSEWLQRWAAFAIVFGLMLVTVAFFLLLGYRKVKKLRAPERTISSVRETAAALRPRRDTGDELATTPERAAAAPGAPRG
ncbi:phage holin family protein [Amycolatopsis cihanbeyliensis]|uniref:Putative superfamily III holin-X n=1 Tax=Amycolatopsis cihanbeyliensis TaxID=1128664 RepID=A0A542DN12_AMYCI|nr:phage holin family protein [Amycolatopsis cihanbeyliensis]TQJ04447.1 putative superfamily III holin-X [Amycolatopsis cihanbeyliensis]